MSRAEPIAVDGWMLAWLPDASGSCPECGGPFTDAHCYLRVDERPSESNLVETEPVYEKRCISCILKAPE